MIRLDQLPQKHFGAIYADPPWQYKAWTKKGDAAHGVPEYDQMDLGSIMSLQVEPLAADDCALFLWITWPTLPEAMSTIAAWGFEYKTCAFSWMKANQYKLFALEEDVYMGLGHWTRANSEVCLLATRGTPKRLAADVRQGIIEPRREHSRKPDCVPERIERLVKGPYLEMFARTSRPGWTSWGNQVDKFVSEVA